eukprot:gene6570-7521_t
MRKDKHTSHMQPHHLDIREHRKHKANASQQHQSIPTVPRCVGRTAHNIHANAAALGSTGGWTLTCRCFCLRKFIDDMHKHLCWVTLQAVCQAAVTPRREVQAKGI